MGARTSQFLAIIFTALAFVPGAAHLMELPAKIDMPEHPYFIVQQIYSGWAWAAVAIFAALLANLGSAILAPRQSRQFWLSTAAGILIAATLAIFFIWTYPANQATANWTSVPEGWERLRAQWEYSHAVNAMITFAALLCSVAAALSSDVARRVVTPSDRPVSSRGTSRQAF